MTALTSIALFIFSVIAYSLKELQAQKKLKWQKDDTSFWGEKSYRRKYKLHHGVAYLEALDNWYYNFFKIDYRERFHGSATIFVSFTDGYHLCQLVFKVLLIGSLVMYKEMVNPWIDGLIYFGVFGLCFTIVYKELSR